MNNTGKLLTIASLFLFSSCSYEKEQNRNVQLTGMYKLLTIQVPGLNGSWHEEDWARGGKSYILYDGKGHMMVQIIPKGYENFQWMKEEDAIDAAKVKASTDAMGMDELRATVNEFAVCYTYVAGYTIDSANIITHHRLASSIPGIWGTDVKRGFEFRGDTLILQNLATKRKLLWLRQK